MRPDTVEPVAVGALKVSGGRRVRFTLGSFKRGAQTQIQVAERLVLDLVDAKGKILRSLTVKGGARDLMPAEYAYARPTGEPPLGQLRVPGPRLGAAAEASDPTVQRSALLHR